MKYFRYEVRVRAATQSLVGDKLVHHGPWSQVRAVHLQPGCENIQQFSPSRAEDRIVLLNLEEHLGMIAGIICGILGLLSLVLAILLCRRYSQDRSRHYVNEKFYPNNSPTLSKNQMDIGGWDAGIGEDALHAIPVQVQWLVNIFVHNAKYFPLQEAETAILAVALTKSRPDLLTVALQDATRDNLKVALTSAR